MLYYKLKLIGHVHDRPDHVINHSWSWPEGLHEDEVDEMIDKFAMAFTLVSIATDPPR